MSKKIITIAHRGASGHAPENTLKAVAKGLELGADFIEIDVYFIDGELFVIHDNRLERTTNGSGYVQEKSAEYLRSLDAGKGEKIPFLQEVLDLINRQAGVNIELKGNDTAAPVAALIKEYIGKGWSYEDFLVSSFNHHELQRIQTINARIPIGVLIYGLPIDAEKQAADLNATTIHPSIHFINSSFIKNAHQRGLRVLAYTANHPEDIKRMKQLGVDGLFSDYPERLMTE